MDAGSSLMMPLKLSLTSALELVSLSFMDVQISLVLCRSTVVNFLKDCHLI